MKKNLKKNKKGISTIIATIIIVAISIVMAIAVAYWALGIGGAFTRFEKLQFTSAYVTVVSPDDIVHITLKNTGTAAATIDTPNLMLNGQPYGSYASVTVTLNATTLAPGDVAAGTINLPQATWASGTGVEVSVQTTAGNAYPKMIQLP